VKPFNVVKVISLRDKRFENSSVQYMRHPQLGNIGTILEACLQPEPAFEVECVNSKDGTTIWLVAMHPEELELVQAV